MSDTKKEKKGKEFKSKYGLNIEDMFKAGLYLGHIKSRWNPKMAPYIFTVKNGIRVIDLEKSIAKFEEALDFIKKSIEEGKKILFVGTRIQDKDIVRSLAEKLHMPYIAARWVGGLFTNFDVIKKRLQYFRDLESRKASGELGKYTKKEQSLFTKELNDFYGFMGGIKLLDKQPESVFIFDIVKDHYALKEAKKAGRTVIAITNTDADPMLCDFLIPAGNNSLTALNYIAGKIGEIVKVG